MFKTKPSGLKTSNVANGKDVNDNTEKTVRGMTMTTTIRPETIMTILVTASVTGATSVMMGETTATMVTGITTGIVNDFYGDEDYQCRELDVGYVDWWDRDGHENDDAREYRLKYNDNQ